VSSKTGSDKNDVKGLFLLESENQSHEKDRKRSLSSKERERIAYARTSRAKGEKRAACNRLDETRRGLGASFVGGRETIVA